MVKINKIILPGCMPFRVLIWFMIFTCVALYYMLRINISIIILAMVEPIRNADNSVAVPECVADHSNSTLNLSLDHESNEVPNYGVRYNWDSKLQGVILGGYFYGYIVTCPPGGYVTEKFGPKRCVLISLALSAVLTMISPWAASVHSAFLIAVRVLTGIVGGVSYPSAHYLIAKYAPPDERGTFVGALLGNAFGTVVTWPILGAVIEHWGWEWAFYVCGIIIVCWMALFYFLVHDTPEDHPLMSQEEKDYISKSLLSTSLGKVKTTPPYQEMALSVPFWALVVLHFGNLWGLFFLLTAGPNFMSTVLGFTLGHVGILASLPYLARFVCGVLYGKLGDIIYRKGWMGKTALCKTFVISSHILPGVLLLCQTFMGCDATWAIVLLTTSLGMNGASSMTSLKNPHDLAPNFAPSIYGIVNAIGSTTGFINPLIVGYLTAEHNGLAEWHSIFYIGSSIYIGCGIIFWMFGTAEEQTWNAVNREDRTNTIGNGDVEIESIKL